MPSRELSHMITRRAATAGLATTLIGLTGRIAAQAAPPSPSAGDLQGKGQVWNLTAQPTPIRLRPDTAKAADTWTFDGELARVFRAKLGTELRLALKNETSAPLSLHFHGVRSPNEMDGAGYFTQNAALPGESYEYRFIPRDPGTFLIRPCVVGGSAEPMERGLTALLIVEEVDPPEVDQDIALLVDDWQFNDDGSLAPFERSTDPAPLGRLGNWLCVNGKPTPQRIKARPGGRIRLRLANACNARAMRLRFDGLKSHVIAIDGQPTGIFEPLKASLPFAPGTRYDLLVDLPPETGATGAVMALIGEGLSLIEIVTEGEKRPPLPPVGPLPPNPSLPVAIKLENAVRADVVIEGDPKVPGDPWRTNKGQGTPLGESLIKVKRGTPVVLALKNETAFVQPMHLHGHSFRLLHPFDDGWEPYWLDTVQAPENKTIRIAFVADNPGRWMLASTVMERFDAGLWTWIEVT